MFQELSPSNQSGVSMSSTSSTWGGWGEGPGLSFCRTTQRYASDCYDNCCEEELGLCFIDELVFGLLLLCFCIPSLELREVLGN